ncbi:MAG: PadR family transcriptional regulator, partial [Candidatus Micrarchaeota archaeon]
MKMFAKGLLELFILAEASAQPVSGKMVVERVERLSGGAWKPSAGAIYPLLRRMEKQGLITPALSENETGGRREITYSIADMGMHKLDEGKRHCVEYSAQSFQSLVPLATRVLHGSNEELDELFSELHALMKNFQTRLISTPTHKKK